MTSRMRVAVPASPSIYTLDGCRLCLNRRLGFENLSSSNLDQDPADDEPSQIRQSLRVFCSDLAHGVTRLLESCSLREPWRQPVRHLVTRPVVTHNSL